MNEGVWIDSDKLSIDDSVGEVLKHGTLTVGFIGLAEALVALTGKHHGECASSQALGLEIIGENKNGICYHFRGNYEKLTDRYKP